MLRMRVERALGITDLCRSIRHGLTIVTKLCRACRARINFPTAPGSYEPGYDCSALRYANLDAKLRHFFGHTFFDSSFCNSHLRPREG